MISQSRRIRDLLKKPRIPVEHVRFSLYERQEKATMTTNANRFKVGDMLKQKYDINDQIAGRKAEVKKNAYSCERYFNGLEKQELFRRLLSENMVIETIDGRLMRYQLSVKRNIQLDRRSSTLVRDSEVQRALINCKSGSISYFDLEVLNRAVFLTVASVIHEKGLGDRFLKCFS